MTIPTNLLQSQLALNKITINHLHERESFWEFVDKKHCAEALRIKKQIAKYALLQKAIKRSLCEATYDAQHDMFWTLK